MKNIEISTTELYRFLISDLRYGYTRNNHLMPSCAYGESKRLLQNMYSIDKETALITAKQLCEECINDQLDRNFHSGLDDDFGNRKDAINFINYLLDFIHRDDETYKPYNYRLYEINIDRYDNLHYDIIKLDDFDIDIERLFSGYNTDLLNSYEIEYIKKDLTLKEANNMLFDTILNSKQGSYNKRRLELNGRIIGELFRIISPESHKDEVYGIIVTYDLYNSLV